MRDSGGARRWVGEQRWARGWAIVLLLLGLAAFADQPASAFATVLAALVVVCLAGVACLTTARPALVRATSLRHRARHAGVPPLRDPDAPGHARPRAPSA